MIIFPYTRQIVHTAVLTRRKSKHKKQWGFVTVILGGSANPYKDLKAIQHQFFLGGAKHATRKTFILHHKTTSQFTKCNCPSRIDSTYREQKHP